MNLDLLGLKRKLDEERTAGMLTAKELQQGHLALARIEKLLDTAQRRTYAHYKRLERLNYGPR